MPDSSNGDLSNLPQSELTAEQLLTSAIELIIATSDANQLTSDAVDRAFVSHLEPYDDDHAEFTARLTAEWNVSIELSNDEVTGPIVELSFFDKEEGTNASLSDICGVDAAAFASALTAAGFEQTTTYGVHGGISGNDFVRGSVKVMIATQGEASEPSAKLAHRCITSVWIRRRE